MLKLNIPKDKSEQFKEVSFVENMTVNQLKVMIKRLWENFQNLATACQDKHKDVSITIDKILDGHAWKSKELDERHVYGHYKGFMLKFDTLSKKFTILDSNYEPTGDSVQGYTITELKEEIKERKVAA